MINLFQQTPGEINKGIAERLVKIRKRRRISQKDLSVKSGVSLGSLKRFEQTGDISLVSLTKLAIALDLENELESLFSNMPLLSIEEAFNE
ncbi:MAG: helix-turn-helix transcriptional regulator [Clostridiaceae bacterium]|nr:helix-turn-helix transcriptional regulator [Clostridiaceae bacterium]